MIKIITDTTASMTLDEYSNYGIIPIPLYVREGDITKKELFEIKYDEFYRLQRDGHRFATSQPDPNSFIELFRPIVEAGDEIICILLSSGISGSINSANLAAEMVDSTKITIFDSYQSGINQATLAIKAKELADSGATRPEIIASLEKMRSNSRVYFLVESLRYLYEGGRLNGAQALIGSIIQIKPIIWFEADGKMSPFEKVRTLKNAKNRLVELFQEGLGRGMERVGLHYGDNIEEAQEFAALLADMSGVPVSIRQLSPVVGSHTGPDILGLCFITKN